MKIIIIPSYYYAQEIIPIIKIDNFAINYAVPVSTDTRIVGHLVVVNSPLTLPHEPILLTVGPNAGCSHEGLLEVRVDRGTSDRLKTHQLTRGGHVETLQYNREREHSNC